MPAHQVIVTEPFQQQLDGALAADLQQVAVAQPVVLLQIGVCRRRALAVDACALTQRFDGLVPDVVAEFAQLGLCLGVVEQYLGVTHDGQRVVGNRCRLVCLVVDVELDDLVAGQRHCEIGGCRG